MKSQIDDIIISLMAVANDPHAYAAEWKRKAGKPVIGILPMNFPAEIVHAAGALPWVVQEDDAAITYGRSLLFEFYCGYTRSFVDQVATGTLNFLDAFLLVDHCVALLGAVDAVRFELPDTPVFLAQFSASMDETWSRSQVRERVDALRVQLEEVCGCEISTDAIRASSAAYNRNRALLRRLYDLRRARKISLTSRQMQALVKSAMVMDIDEHSEAIETLLRLLEKSRPSATRSVRLHLSGHFCHAPKPELLDMIESCGVTVVDDDLYTGYRYISTDVPVEDDPLAALTSWYFDRNINVPCSTRAQKSVDWESYLETSVRNSGAEGIIVLVAKFCEPHMLYYPELRKRFHAIGMPHLLIETEHEGLALETIKTRVEALVEGIRRTSRVGETA